MNSCLKSVIIFIFFTINWAVSSQEILSTDNTEDWISYAKIIESYMNKNVDPCDNFYEYACGNYKNVVPMFQGKHIQSVQEQLNYEIDYQIGTLLEEEEIEDEVAEQSKNFENEWKLFSTIKGQIRDTKRFYKSCKNSEIFQLKKSEEYLNYIKNELGGWPAIDSNWTETDYDWFKVNVKINRFGTGPFFATDVLGPYYSDFYRRYFGLEKQRDFNKTNNLYQHNMKMMLKLMKMYEIPDNKAKEIADEIMELGHQYSLNVNVSKCYTFYNSSHEVQKILSDKIDDIKQLYDVIPPALEIDFKIIWNGKLCIDNLYEFMKNADKRILANFMALYFLYLLHKPELTSSSETPKQICTRITRDSLAPIPDLMFINSKFYDYELEWQTVEYLRYLQSAFQDSINSREWLESSAKEEAYNKFEYMKFMVGRRSNIIDYSFIRHRFQDYNVTSISNYFGNLMKTLLFKKSKDSIQLINRDLTFVSVNVNAYYVHDGNALQLPAGVISKPLFNKNYPHAYNYGSLGGYVIGHEMAHAIDPLGQRYDSSGSPKYWWKITDTEKFGKPIECFKLQYIDYSKTFSERKLTGKKLNENICDSVGLRQGYRGYKKWLKEKRNSTIEQIPELNMTGKQLYFLAFAHINCKYEINDDNVIPILPGKSDKHHSPTEYRVISSISNMEEFSREFNCPKGSRMNPEDKCFLW